MAELVGLAEAVRGLVEDGQDGWPLRVAADLRETRRPTRRELAALRALPTKGAA
jgi:hypothetical protein